MNLRKLQTQEGQTICVGARIATGAEGVIMQVHDHPQLVAKIYRKPIKPELDAKLRAMTKMEAGSLRSIAAWPRQILIDTHGNTMGFLMTKIEGATDVHNLYSPKSRKIHFPNANQQFLVHASLNIAKAFSVAHANKCVIGDVNHGSVLVSQQAMASLVDCDSFQITEDNKTYRCVVGVDTYTPPELQGRAFAEIDRTPNHDAFGLAVMIFHLLFMGRHPFAGRYSGPDEMTLDRAIKEGRFAYGSRAAMLKMSPPPHTPPLSIVSPQLALMFERAFTPGTIRPAAAEWVDALKQFANDIRQINPPYNTANRQPNAKRGENIYATAFVEKDVCEFGGVINIKLMTGKSYEISIPRNTRENEKLRLRGAGSAGKNGGDNGDAIIKIAVIPNSDNATIPSNQKRRIVCKFCNLGPADGRALKKVNNVFYCDTHLPPFEINKNN